MLKVAASLHGFARHVEQGSALQCIKDALLAATARTSQSHDIAPLTRLLEAQAVPQQTPKRLRDVQPR